MTTALSQQPATHPTQLPGHTVLRIDTAQTPATLVQDLASERDVLACRVMLDATQAEGGELSIAGGIDGRGVGVWRLVLDAAASQVRLVVGSQQALAPLQAPFAWQQVEAVLDAATGSAALRLNGIERDSITTSFNATRRAWLGGALFGPGLTGTVELDQWALATTPIGTAAPQPLHDHAGDPRRWLVIYNRSDADSAAWAQAYRARRAVPYANLCGLDLPGDETISAAAYQQMRQQIDDYLSDNGLASRVVGLLLGYGVPGYTDLQSLGQPTPIAAYLHTNDTHGNAVVNPLLQDPVTTRPTADDYASARLTGRIDAPTLAEALALLDRADAIADQPLAHDGGADLLIDINPDNPNVGPVYSEPVAEWAGGDGLARLRLPATVYDETAPASASAEACVWGWRDAAPPAGFFAAPAGRRALCTQLHPEPLAADTRRDPAAGDWLNAAIAAGYAAAAAPSRAYSLSAAPLPHRMFEALRLGWTLAEAWAIAQPFLRDGLQLVGDPLMRLGFPKAGYDVFGPADRLDSIDLSQPIARLHAGQRSLDIDPIVQPSPDTPARYLVQRLDNDGRADHASAATYAAVVDEQSIRPADLAWPTHDGWRVVQQRGRLVVAAYWPSAPASLGVDRVQLESQTSSDPPQLLAELTPQAGGCRVVFTIDRPDQRTRYRFRVVQGPASFPSPWSAWVDPASEISPALPLILAEPSA